MMEEENTTAHSTSRKALRELHNSRLELYVATVYGKLKEFFDQLSPAVVAVRVNFSGSGDNGHVDDIQYCTKLDNRWFMEEMTEPSGVIRVPVPPPEIPYRETTLSEWDILQHTVEVNDVVIMLFDALVGRYWDFDYYNNEGGGGTLTVRFDKNIIEPSFYINTVQEFYVSSVPGFDASAEEKNRGEEEEGSRASD
jgi:hypothetical protein